MRQAWTVRRSRDLRHYARSPYSAVYRRAIIGIGRAIYTYCMSSNAQDAEPPLYLNWQQANTDPSLYDVPGRRDQLAFQYDF